MWDPTRVRASFVTALNKPPCSSLFPLAPFDAVCNGLIIIKYFGPDSQLVSISRAPVTSVGLDQFTAAEELALYLTA